jgi:hypothetical protein
MHGERRFFASSKTAWMLLSVVAAFALLAWSAQQDAQHAPAAASASFLYGVDQIVTPAGRGFFGRIGGVGVVSGVDTVTGAGRSALCTSITWQRGKPASVTVVPCHPGVGRWRLRKLP